MNTYTITYDTTFEGRNVSDTIKAYSWRREGGRVIFDLGKNVPPLILFGVKDITVEVE
jgi:hypothetical protein